MNKKETTINAIKEMDINLLDIIFDNNVYMGVPKDLFINKLNSEFEYLKKQGINSFDKVVENECYTCDDKLNKYVKQNGYTFLSKDYHHLGLAIIEKNNEIINIITCDSNLVNEKFDIKKKIFLTFKKDEMVDYNPSSNLLVQQKQINVAIKEFKKFENNITDINTFIKWRYNYRELFESVRYKIREYSFVEPFILIYNSVGNINDLIKYHNFAQKAMQEYNKINFKNENEVIEWLIKYENNELYIFFGFIVTENWKKTNFILFNNIKSDFENIIIDVKEYKESVDFANNYSDLYYDYLDKYKPNKRVVGNYDLSQRPLSAFLYTNGLFLEILKKYERTN